jgi:hydroxymethylpyrimidine/phosphomethylpyrimidine kinase
VDAVKTGMLVDAEVVEVISQRLKVRKIRKIIVDPVMVSKNGVSLLASSALSTLKNALIPLAFVVTPNLREASLLTRKPVKTIAQMKDAAKKIHQMGAQNILIKGGHLQGIPIDILYNGSTWYKFEAERIDTPHTHGTGCTLSAALATEIAKGVPLIEAVKTAKELTTSSIRFSLGLGRGCGPVNPYVFFAGSRQIHDCSTELKRAVQKLKEGFIGHLIPEVQSNLGYALPYAASTEEVVSFPGRIIRVNNGIVTVDDPVPGASHHIAQVILTVMKHNPDFRAAMNIKYSAEIIRKCRSLHLTVGRFDRKDEPRRIKRKEGATLSWGVESLLKTRKIIPDVIYDQGDHGKEPMVRVIGKTPLDVTDKVLRIANGLKGV